MNVGEEAWKSGKQQRYTGVWRNGQGEQTVLARCEVPGRCVRLSRTRQHSAAHRQAAQHNLGRTLDFNSDFDKVKRRTGKLRL